MKMVKNDKFKMMSAQNLLSEYVNLGGSSEKKD